MKKMLLPALLGAALLTAPAAFAQNAVAYAAKPAKGAKATRRATKTAAATIYKLQPQLSTLGWEGKAVTHGHNGTMQFTSGELTATGDQLTGGTVTVDMKSIKATDITDADSHAISFPAKVGVKGGVAAASGTVTIDRTKFGLKYGSKNFFSSIGDKAINDDFTLSFNVIAKQ